MTVILFIAVLVLLIVAHEFGHFIVAKLSKMRVDEFGIGFPPKIVGKKIGETEYTINWLPFGGFVRIFGEDSEVGVDERAFSNRPKRLQAATLVAGPFANIVLAFVLSSMAFIVGTPTVIDSEEELARADNQRVLIGAVLPESPAAMAGIMPGDEIYALVSGEEVLNIHHPDQISELVTNPEETFELRVKRNDEEIAFKVSPVTGLIEEEPNRVAIGIAMALVGTVSYNPVEALVKGFQDTAQDFVFILVSLIGLIGSALTFSADVSNLAGPVGIASLTGEAAAFGLGSLFSFAALLSINLAIINILPFPALDGGRLLFLGIETVTRRKIPSSVAQTVNAAGFFILILLMIAITVGDISRLMG